MKKIRVSIDEAGDLGFNFEKGASKYFNMTAVIDEDIKNDSAGDIIKKIAIDVFGKEETKKIHFRNATAIQKQNMVQMVANQNLNTITVVTDKTHFKKENIAKDSYLYIKQNCSRGFELYMYSLECLLIEVSKNTLETDTEILVDIAECGGTISKKSTKKLIQSLVRENKIKDIFKSIQVKVANQKCSLQVADIIASSIYASIEPSQLFIAIYMIGLLPVINKKIINGQPLILDVGICFTHRYTTEKVFQVYPWLNNIGEIYNNLFPKRSNLSIV